MPRSYGSPSILIRSPTSSTTRLTVHFTSTHINTVVTYETEVVNEWIRDVRASHSNRRMIIGLDCEWKPNYHSQTTPTVTILQLCVGTSCLILQLFYVNRIPDSIEGFLGDPNIRFVGIGVGDDVAKLANDYVLVCATWVDLENMCNDYLGLVGRRRLGLKGYSWEVLGLTMEKPRHVTRSNWETRALDGAQIQYACIDAYVPYKLGRKLLAQ